MSRTAWSPSETVRPAPGPQAVTWAVYRLRREGQKLEPADALATRRDGWLRIEPFGSILRARLYVQSGPTFCRDGVSEMGSLDGVKLVKLVEGGVLLHGTEIVPSSEDWTPHLQAWWCVLVDLQPWPHPEFSEKA